MSLEVCFARALGNLVSSLFLDTGISFYNVCFPYCASIPFIDKVFTIPKRKLFVYFLLPSSLLTHILCERMNNQKCHGPFHLACN